MPIRNRIVYYSGNIIDNGDNKIFSIIPYLIRKFPKLTFIHLDPTEDVVINDEKMIILDTVINGKVLTVYHDLNEFIPSPRFSVHDFDLPLYLSLLIKTGRVKELMIIGIPGKEKNLEGIVRKLIPIFRSI